MILFNIIPCTMFNRPASSLAVFSKASRVVSKAHSVAFISTLKMLFIHSSHSPPFNAKYQYFIIWGVQSVFALLFTCSRYSLAGDSRCHWPCIPSLSFSASFMNVFAFTLSSEKYSHIPCICWSFPSILRGVPRCAFFSTTAFHCRFFEGARPFAVKLQL